MPARPTKVTTFKLISMTSKGQFISLAFGSVENVKGGILADRLGWPRVASGGLQWESGQGIPIRGGHRRKQPEVERVTPGKIRG